MWVVVAVLALPILLAVALILKLCGVVDWSWKIVLAPLWVPAIAALLWLLIWGLIWVVLIGLLEFIAK